MRLYTNDDIYRPDDRWLGPAGRTLPFTVSIKAIGAFALIAFAGRAVLGLLGLHGGGLYAADAAVSLALTLAVRCGVSHERPMRAVLAIFGHEISAPRPKQAQVVTARLNPSQLRARQLPQPRRPRRGIRGH